MGKNLYTVKEHVHDLIIHDHHLIRKHHIYFLNRLRSKEIYNFLISQKNKQLHQDYIYQEKFNDNNLDWKNIYSLV